MDTRTKIIVNELEYKTLYPLLYTDDGFYANGIVCIISEPFTNWFNIICEDHQTRKALAELIIEQGINSSCVNNL